MMREYKRYDEYKDSGIDYLKTIPKNWSKMKIKYIAKNNFESFIDGDWIESPYIQDEGIRLIQTGNIGNGRYIEKGDRYISEETFIKLKCTEIFPNDILICRLAEPVGRACLAPQLNNRMITSVDVCRLTPKDKYLKKFIIYYMQMYKYLDYIESLARGSTRQRISRSQLGEVYITIPPRQEQQKIASFLDQKTAEIDEILNKKEKLIDHLEKYKKSVITEAVTKGKLGDKYINEDGELVDNIEMKDSGVEWIGKFPSEWELIKFKYLFSYQKGNSPNEYVDKVNGVPYLSMDYLRGNTDEITYVRNDPNMIKVENNQILLLWDGSNSGEFIKSNKGILSSTMSVINDIKLNKDFSFYYFKASEKYLKDQTIGMGIPHVDSKILKNIYLTVPSDKEQQKIASFLDQKTAEIDDIISKKEKLIDLLEKYKKSLIFKAVTGKIDLRNYELEGGKEIVEHNNSREAERKELSEVN
jgi:type I restriction enzyme S subunit